MQLQTHRFPGIVATDHVFRVPVDHDNPHASSLDVYAREVVAANSEKDDLPWLVFFQGGPGFQSPRPTEKSGWLKSALKKYRVLLLDQRGTGRSNRVCQQSLARFESPKDQAEYLSYFRMDAIVRDAELIRAELTGGKPWTILGQSYGGFCAVRYLSSSPEGLEAVLITGGLPSLDGSVDDVYRATYPRVIDRNRRFFARYPHDVDRVREIAVYLEQNEVTLPGGGRFKPRMLQQLGLAFGMSDGFESVHYLLEDAWGEGVSGRELSYFFLRGFEAAIPFQTNPIFAVLHEPIYCQGFASRWSAERLRDNYPEFSADDPLCFTGEMIYPSMFEDYPELRPLRDAAHILAEKDDWPRLYDMEVLGRNTVPVIATVYADDMYVDRSLSEQTAERIGNTRIWLTNEYDHNGLRADGERVLGRMLDMLNGEA
jgi:pimeloyl-ACP methyl ester carboxylesterase